MHADTIQAMNQYVGSQFTLPLFKAYKSDPAGYKPGVGSGSNYDYNIVRFVGVKIMPAGKDNKEIIVVPAAIIDPSYVFAPGTVTPAGTSGRFETTFTVPRLSR